MTSPSGDRQPGHGTSASRYRASPEAGDRRRETRFSAPVRANVFAVRKQGDVEMIVALIVAFVVFLLATFPATWLLMLFLGNCHLGLSYWGTLPLGILVSLLISGATSGLEPPGRSI